MKFWRGHSSLVLLLNMKRDAACARANRLPQPFLSNLGVTQTCGARTTRLIHSPILGASSLTLKDLFRVRPQLQVEHFIRSSHCHVRPLWQLPVSRSCFLVNESHGVPDQVVDVPQIHALARFIEPERASNWYAGTCRRYPFVRSPNMLEMIRNNVHQPAFHRFLAPLLTQFRGPEPAFLGRAIDGVEDRHASEVSQPNRATVAMEIVERRTDYDFDVSSQGFHIRCPKHCPSDRIPLHYIPAHLPLVRS